MTSSETSPDDLPSPGDGPVAPRGVVLALAIATGVTLRWAALDRESLWFDEGFSWWLASLEPAQMLRQFSRDVQTPGYFVLLHYWTMLFGDSPLAMRSLSAALSTLCIGVAWLLARELLGRGWARVLGTSLFALSPLQVLHAREARYYPLLTLLVLLGWLALLRWTRTRRRRWLALLAFSTAGALYTHNMMLLYLPALAAGWLLFDHRRPLRRRLLEMTLTVSAVILLWLPWVPTFLGQLHWTQGRFWAARPGAADLLETLASLAGANVFSLNSLGWEAFSWLGLKPPLRGAEAWSVVMLAALLTAAALALFRRQTRRRALLLLALLLIPVLVSFARSLWSQPVFLTRTFIPGTAAASLLLALPTTIGPRRWRRCCAGLAASVLLLSLLSSGSVVATHRQEDWRGAYAVVRELPGEDTLLVFVANEGEVVFRFYESRERHAPRFARIGLPSGYFDTDPPEPVRRVLDDADLALLRAALAEKPLRRVVLIYAHEHFSDPARLTERYLDEHMTPLRRHRLNHVTVSEYARK